MSEQNNNTQPAECQIDFNTGKMEFDGVVIEPTSLIDDFEKYPPEKVDILRSNNSRGIIWLNNKIKSNGIKARVTISIDEKAGLRDVTITPSLKGLKDYNLLDASKQWLKGILSGNYEEDEDSIIGGYEWGYLYAKYREDIHYGIVGGEITVFYN